MTLGEPPSDHDLVSVVDRAMEGFRGNSSELESAIGALFVGRRFGWKVLFLIHSKATIRKYEKILGVTFRDVLPETGPLSRKSVAWVTVEKIGGFWKVVKGEKPGVKTPDFKAKP